MLDDIDFNDLQFVRDPGISSIFADCHRGEHDRPRALYWLAIASNLCGEDLKARIAHALGPVEWAEVVRISEELGPVRVVDLEVAAAVFELRATALHVLSRLEFDEVACVAERRRIAANLTQVWTPTELNGVQDPVRREDIRRFLQANAPPDK